jgi:hypothetical protein
MKDGDAANVLPANTLRKVKSPAFEELEEVFAPEGVLVGVVATPVR